MGCPCTMGDQLSSFNGRVSEQDDVSTTSCGQLWALVCGSVASVSWWWVQEKDVSQGSRGSAIPYPLCDSHRGLRAWTVSLWWALLCWQLCRFCPSFASHQLERHHCPSWALQEPARLGRSWLCLDHTEICQGVTMRVWCPLLVRHMGLSTLCHWECPLQKNSGTCGLGLGHVDKEAMSLCSRAEFSPYPPLGWQGRY